VDLVSRFRHLALAHFANEDFIRSSQVDHGPTKTWRGNRTQTPESDQLTTSTQADGPVDISGSITFIRPSIDPVEKIDGSELGLGQHP
jgi:hypothetical protein